LSISDIEILLESIKVLNTKPNAVNGKGSVQDYIEASGGIQPVRVKSNQNVFFISSTKIGRF